MQESNPPYAVRFRDWAEQANSILQFTIWSLLESEGFGANLQYYNPIIDDEVKAAFDIPKSWGSLLKCPLESLPHSLLQRNFHL